MHVLFPVFHPKQRQKTVSFVIYLIMCSNTAVTPDRDTQCARHTRSNVRNTRGRGRFRPRNVQKSTRNINYGSGFFLNLMKIAPVKILPLSTFL